MGPQSHAQHGQAGLPSRTQPFPAPTGRNHTLSTGRRDYLLGRSRSPHPLAASSDAPVPAAVGQRCLSVKCVNSRCCGGAGWRAARGKSRGQQHMGAKEACSAWAKKERGSGRGAVDLGRNHAQRRGRRACVAGQGTRDGTGLGLLKREYRGRQGHARAAAACAAGGWRRGGGGGQLMGEEGTRQVGGMISCFAIGAAAGWRAHGGSGSRGGWQRKGQALCGGDGKDGRSGLGSTLRQHGMR